MKPSAPPQWNERTTQQLVRYEALFSLLSDLQLEDDVSRIADSAARRWKYFANAASWRLLLLRNGAQLLIEASRGQARVTECAETPPWEASMLAEIKPRLIALGDQANAPAHLPESFRGPGVHEVKVLPFMRDEHCIALLSVAARHTPFSDLDERFIHLFGGYLSDRLTSTLIQRDATAALVDRATRDSLTGLLNRGTALDLLQSLLAKKDPSSAPIGVVLGDIDFFKALNDRYGHHAGDEVLREVAQRLKTALRTDEWVGRYGGEEFVVLLGECSPQGIGAIAERLRLAIAQAPVLIDGRSIDVTMSFGTATSHSMPDHRIETLLQCADRALYRAKAEGRNRVVAGD